MPLKTIILAAGQGTRMKSRLPKVLHRLAGQPLLQWVLNAARTVAPTQIIVVYGEQGKKIKSVINDDNILWVHQENQLGTGHAIEQTLAYLDDADQILVLLADIPLIDPHTLQRLCANVEQQTCRLVTTTVDDATGLGRIIRDDNNNVRAIIEEQDASEDERNIKEINTGIMLLPAIKLKSWLPKLNCNNVQREYYLTDIIALAAADKIRIDTVQPSLVEEVLGVNNRQQLAYLERFYQCHSAQQLMQQGITLADPLRFDLRGRLDSATDVNIDINVIIEGNVKIGTGCDIGPNVILKNVTLGDNVTILANCLLEDSIIGDHCIIGPFARLRPGTQLADNVKVGNFVETKKACVGTGSKLPHLSYLGDVDIGKNVNIGAGTITCNYDGVNKYKTTIGDGAFIGSDSQLIAPVTIGTNAYIGSGSTINKNAPAGKLTLSRGRQKTIDHWRPLPKK